MVLQKIENLDAVADTLEELWISYNVIPGLVSSWCLSVSYVASAEGQRLRLLGTHLFVLQAGIEKLVNLKTLLMSNNKIAGWAEIERLGNIATLEVRQIAWEMFAVVSLNACTLSCSCA